MNFKFPFWTLFLAFALFFPIIYFNVIWLSLFPLAYIIYAFIIKKEIRKK